MNVALLEKIADVIVAQPENFDMSDWHTTTKCGTAHCIGGWALVLSGKEVTRKNCESQAATLLEIDEIQAISLFYKIFWPIQFSLKLKVYTDAANAAARIRHFIATGGAE